MKFYKVLPFLLFTFLVTVSFGQSDRERAEEYRLQIEQRKRAQTLMVLDSAVRYMEEGRYELANTKLVFVLNNIKSVPSDLTFFFGKNSFYLKKYKQSIDWLNKYIQLKGTQGQYSAEAVELLKVAEEEIIKERNQNAKKVEQILSSTFEIDCGPAGKVTCPVCKGTTVIIKKGYLANEYKTCPYCDTHGNLSCDQYNLLLKGQLTPRNE